MLLVLLMVTSAVGLEPPHSLQVNTSSNHCTGLASCLDYALNVIRSSQRYTLLEGVWFDAANGTDHGYLLKASDPATLADLVRSAARLFDTHYLVWRIAPGLNVKVYKRDEDKFGMSVLRDVYPVKNERRTFGIGKRRIMMALLPIMYKLGVITTLLVALTVITLKTLTIGVVLLMLSFGGILTKLKGHAGDHDHAHKDVHIHVHPFPGGKPHYTSYHSEYSPWSREGDSSLEDVTAQPSSTTISSAWASAYLPPFMSY